MPLPEMLEKVLQQGELTLLDEIINKVQSCNEELRMSNIRNRENLNPDLQVQVLSEDSFGLTFGVLKLFLSSLNLEF